MAPSGWKNVDMVDDAARYVRKLDAINQLEYVREGQRVGYNLLGVTPGDCILDVGCGIGDDVKRIAEITGKTGRVIGIDLSRKLMIEAHKRLGDLPQVIYAVGDAHQLAFPDNTFDGCWATRVFHHLDNPRQALGELKRVTRPGGRVALAEGDWETLVVDAPVEPTRTILNYQCDSLTNGWIGRKLPRLFREVGLEDITIWSGTLIIDRLDMAEHAFGLQRTAKQAAEAGAITEEQKQEWIDHLNAADSSGTFFAAVTGFTIAGTKA